MMPPSKLSRDERLLLLKFVCAFAWADLKVRESERGFVRRLARRLELDTEETAQVEHWLVIAPSPASVDPKQIPVEQRKLFLEAVRAVIFVDGEVDAEERAQLDRLTAALEDQG